MRNIALKLRYDGSAYHGWQRQKNEITVQETLENALSKLCKAPVKASGCGRTDAGVHALRYCANFKSDCTVPLDRLPLAVNALLPPDIAVLHAVEAPKDFNAVLSCSKKEYTYQIYNARIADPFLAQRAYFYPGPLDLAKMQRAASYFVGTHDFAAVRSVGTNVKSTVRTVYWFEGWQEKDILFFRVCANGFLYNMVRAMVGTLIYASQGKFAPEDIPALLDRGNRCLTGPTVPPQGLYMSRIWYDGAVGEMMREN